MANFVRFILPWSYFVFVAVDEYRRHNVFVYTSMIALTIISGYGIVSLLRFRSFPDYSLPPIIRIITTLSLTGAIIAGIMLSRDSIWSSLAAVGALGSIIVLWWVSPKPIPLKTPPLHI